MNHLPLILASQSLRRRELLSVAGWLFNIQVADIDETQHPNEPALEYVRRMATEKAQAVATHQTQPVVVIAADTIVADGTVILGKPTNLAEAEATLRQLRGRNHWVHTAVAVCQVGQAKLLLDVCSTEVQMRAYSDNELRSYVATGDPLDKAGAYAIQHPHFRPAVVQTCYANVVGLPLCHLTRLLIQFGLTPPTAVDAACQSHNHFNCTVSTHILAGEKSA